GPFSMAGPGTPAFAVWQAEYGDPGRRLGTGLHRRTGVADHCPFWNGAGSERRAKKFKERSADDCLAHLGRSRATALPARPPNHRGGTRIIEVGLGVMLLVSAGLLVRSFVNILRTETGFDPSRMLTGVTILRDDQGDRVWAQERTRSFINRLLEKLKALPG